MREWRKNFHKFLMGSSAYLPKRRWFRWPMEADGKPVLAIRNGHRVRSRVGEGNVDCWPLFTNGGEATSSRLFDA